MDSSTVICRMSPFVIFGVSGLVFCFILFLMENPVSKQCRPWLDATIIGVLFESALFASGPFTGFQVRIG